SRARCRAAGCKGRRLWPACSTADSGVARRPERARNLRRPCAKERRDMKNATPTQRRNAPSRDAGKVVRLDTGKRPAARARERSDVRWIPIPEDLFQSALALRIDVQRRLRMRPDTSVVVAALLAQALAMDGIADAVGRYALSMHRPPEDTPAEPPGEPMA